MVKFKYDVRLWNVLVTICVEYSYVSVSKYELVLIYSNAVEAAGKVAVFGRLH